MKFTLIAEDESNVCTSTFEEVVLDAVFLRVKTFLLGAGFVFDPCATLELINDE